MTAAEQPERYPLPGLADVYLDIHDPTVPNLRIVLRPEYQGDLRDIARETDGPDDVYLQCDHVSAKDNQRLAMFMQTMVHHDCDGDGTPDCQVVIDAIENALYQTRETPPDFRRPADGLYTRLVMWLMPKAPVRHIVMGYGKLTNRIRPHQYPWVVLMIVSFFGLVWLQEWLWSPMKYSVITGFLALTSWLGLPEWAGIILFIVGLNLLRRFDPKSDTGESSLSRYTVGFFSKAAVFEEQAFREGSEDWTFWQRFRSCLAFGLIHMVNLIYPLASILPLALGGAVFMAMYLRKYRQTGSRRAAVLRAAVWHRAYNRIALWVAVISLIVWFGYLAIGIIAALALLVGIGLVWGRRNLRQSQTTDTAPARVSTSKQ